MANNEETTASAAPSGQTTAQSAGDARRFPFASARAVVALAIAVVAIVGAVLHLGVGVPCAIGVEQVAAICPVGALEVMLGSKEVMLHPLVLLGIAVIVILVVGKAFCSWVCPVPWVKRLFKGKKGSGDGDSQGHADGSDKRSQNAVAIDDSQVRAGAPLVAPGRLQQVATTIASTVIDELPQSPVNPAEAISPIDPAFSIAPELGRAHASHTCGGCAGCEALKAVGGKRDGVQVDSRHIVLLGALGSAAVFGFPVLCLICPVGLTFAFLIGLTNMFQFNEPTLALVAAPIVLVIEVVFLRKWCTRLCPISALVSLISTGNKTLKPKVDESKCLRTQGIDCHACVEACPEQLDPHTKMIPECSKCGACVTACPARAISIKALRLK